MFAILFRALAKPSKRQDLLDFLKKDAKFCEDYEPGTLSFDVLQDPENEMAFYVYEAYKDREAFEEHTRNVPYRDWNEHIKNELVAESTDIFKGEPLCSPGRRGD
jgi:(4S)-4-hydroxy-5-phosphonooxypentane-2,3-dione isomerase